MILLVALLSRASLTTFAVTSALMTARSPGFETGIPNTSYAWSDCYQAAAVRKKLDFRRNAHRVDTIRDNEGAR